MIIDSELSRLGRSSVSEIFKILDTIQDKKASLYVIQDGIQINGSELSVYVDKQCNNNCTLLMTAPVCLSAAPVQLSGFPVARVDDTPWLKTCCFNS